MINYIQTGERMNYTAGGSAITSGTMTLIGVRLGIAVADIAANAAGVMAMAGVFEIVKLSTDVVTQGALLYWDDTAKNLTLTSAGNTLAGYATAAAGNGITVVKIKINA